MMIKNLREKSINASRELGWKVVDCADGSVQFSWNSKLWFSIPGKNIAHEIYDYYQKFDVVGYVNKLAQCQSSPCVNKDFRKSIPAAISDLWANGESMEKELEKLMSATEDCASQYMCLVSAAYGHNRRGELITLQNFDGQTALYFDDLLPDTEFFYRYELESDKNGNVAYICEGAAESRYCGTILTKSELCNGKECVPCKYEDILFTCEVMSVPEYAVY